MSTLEQAKNECFRIIYDNLVNPADWWTAESYEPNYDFFRAKFGLKNQDISEIHQSAIKRYKDSKGLVKKAINTLTIKRNEVLAEIDNCDISWELNKVRDLQLEASSFANAIGRLHISLGEL